MLIQETSLKFSRSQIQKGIREGGSVKKGSYTGQEGKRGTKVHCVNVRNSQIIKIGIFKEVSE